MQRMAWLFTRGESSVSMTVEEKPGVVRLLVRGPGTATATYNFPDLTQLMEFARLQERRLHDDGFQLQAVTERRNRPDRRQASRSPTPDRRQ